MNLDKPRRYSRRRMRRVTVHQSDLPQSVPDGAVCNVSFVTDRSTLKRGDLVMLLKDGEFRPRRFLRAAGDWNWMAGDNLFDQKPEAYSGDLYRIHTIYLGRSPAGTPQAGPSNFLHWILSFVD